MARGRPPLGPQLVDHLHGDAAAKQRLQVVLESLAGLRSIEDACATLGIHEARFHELRAEVLQAALERLTPKAPGRPRQQTPEQEAQMASLEAQIRDLKIELQAARVREEIAVAMPHLLQPPKDPGKKTPLPTNALDRIRDRP
jgi:hypothetical protein